MHTPPNSPLIDVARTLADLAASALPLALLAALGGIVRSMQAGRCGLKAVCVAAVSAGFSGLVVHLLIAESGLPTGVQAAFVGISGYASGEILKILAVRACKWAETATPRQ